MTRDKLVERIAQVTVSKGVARAVLDELDRAGLCIVPREPTQEMQLAGLEAIVAAIEQHRPAPEAPRDERIAHMGALIRNSKETDAVYRAMIAAAGEG